MTDWHTWRREKKREKKMDFLISSSFTVSLCGLILSFRQKPEMLWKSKPRIWPLKCSSKSLQIHRLIEALVLRSNNFKCSSIVEFSRWWVLKCKIFAQESICSKESFLKQLWFIKICQNLTFKVNFLCQKSTEFFQIKKKHLRISI